MRGVEGKGYGVSTRNQTNDVQLTPRAKHAQAKSMGAGLSRVWKSLKNCSIVSAFREPKLQNEFLKQAWRRGDDRNLVKTFSALVDLTTSGAKINYDQLTPAQKSRLSHNLLNHGEIIAALKKTIETTPPGEFRNFLVELSDLLRDVYWGVGGAPGESVRGNKEKCDQLINALKSAWQKGDAGGTPAERIQEQLQQLKENPAAFKQAPYDLATIKEKLGSSGSIDSPEAEVLILAVMQGSREVPKFDFGDYVDNFMNASAEQRKNFLAFVQDATLAGDDAYIYFDVGLGYPGACTAHSGPRRPEASRDVYT